MVVLREWSFESLYILMLLSFNVLIALKWKDGEFKEKKKYTNTLSLILVSLLPLIRKA